MKTYKSHTFSGSIFALLAVLLAIPAASTVASKPNIVFFLIDDLGWADLGCYGSTYYKTPNIDRLAAEGMKFTDGYAACPVCSPTRASIMTGKYPARLNLTDWLPGRADRPDQKLARPQIRQQLPLEELTVAEALKPAGYVTAHIGKWHLGGEGFAPEQQGFDLNIAGDHTGTPLSYFAPFKNQQRYMPGLEKADEGEYLTDRLTTEAERFIDQNKEKPFFLYFPHYTVHTPMRAKKELIEKYAAMPTSKGQTNAIYAAMIHSLDESVGRIVKKLEDLKLSENTIIIFTSDNGGLCTIEGPNTPATLNAPLREGKGWLYEGGIRVNWLVKWPGVVKPGSVTKTPVSSVDFYPTLLEMAGVKPPSGQVIDGVSLVSLFKGGDEPKRDAIYWHYPHYSNQGGKPGGVIRSGDFKLIEFYENGRLELFNLKDDMRESRNLAEEMPAKAMELQRKLDAWRRAVDARMMMPNPDYQPIQQGTNGVLILHARQAEVHGTMLRYEPLPHKNTLGFWTRKEDWASWEFEVKQPGVFKVEILQGCGTGSGGSEVEFAIGSQALVITVQETGGFQNFVAREIGTMKLEPGVHKLTVKVLAKPSKAVMDLRQVRLIPVK